MRPFLILLTFFFTALCFSQNSGSISGVLLDSESVNEPLSFAKVELKETGAEFISDEKGEFKFSNLTEGTYTLLASFVGYNNKELKIKVVSGKTAQIKLPLTASTISLDELVLTLASVDSETKTDQSSAQ
ncbi:carboxypeptidase-like regulatory domain-containing protein [Aestuariivivens marinum]|uniref:carboxypeptidase-like regulatory domain-containing protein n=1 Tax=Aestuariivivens marinum TaxID=2913555 RepID=UPI001F5752D6|nr:carboxypeptidase-like regulatory domain-containing protein [Aestuariivivens marinum]